MIELVGEEEKVSIFNVNLQYSIFLNHKTG